jgi:hypothetical protein
MSTLDGTAEDATGCRQRSMGRRTIPLGGWGKQNDPESGKLLDEERENWKPNLTVVKATVQFFKETGRFVYQPEEGQVGRKKDSHSFYKIRDKAANLFYLVRCLYKDGSYGHRE